MGIEIIEKFKKMDSRFRLPSGSQAGIWKKK
jgi:hypothetical protein